MVFGRLFRSTSDPKRRDSGRRRDQPRPTRPYSIHASGRRCAETSHDAMAAYQHASDIYEAEATELSRSEASKRNRNDIEYKRHMQMIEQRMIAERRHINTFLSQERAANVAKYRAGKYGDYELDKADRKSNKRADEKWAFWVKWQRDEQLKAQRIFDSRGEEIAESTGTMLRIAREKRERNQMRARY